MNTIFSNSWWIFLLRGVFAFSLGIMALVIPGIQFTGLLIPLGIYIFADGVFLASTSCKARKQFAYWKWVLLAGVFNLFIGAAFILNPFGHDISIAYIVAGWVLLSGIAEIGIAIRLQKVFQAERWYIFAGIQSFIFGFLIFINPVYGGNAIVFLLGIYTLTAGFMFTLLSTRLWMRHVRILPSFEIKISK